MPRIAPSQEPVPNIDAATENANSVKIMREENEALVKVLEHLIDNPPAPAIKLKPKERWQWFLDHIAEAYYTGLPPQGPEDVQPSWDDFLAWPAFYDARGIAQEIGSLTLEDYVDRLKAGRVPVPMSRPFVNYVPHMMLGLGVWQKLFRKLWQQYGEKGAERPQERAEPTQTPEVTY